MPKREEKEGTTKARTWSGRDAYETIKTASLDWIALRLSRGRATQDEVKGLSDSKRLAAP